ncbi:MAG: hypothetical protein MJ113_04480 [Lachnospiraceae bacterium]|nr:hypothetical protein [Lachnospiraceae bacterium]
MKLFLKNLIRKNDDEMSDSEVISLMQNLDREFEMAELSVTDDLIHRTMNRIESGEEPALEPEREMKPFVKMIYKWLNLIGLGDYSQLGIVAAALGVVIVFGIFTQAVPRISSKAEMNSKEAMYMVDMIPENGNNATSGMVSSSIFTSSKENDNDMMKENSSVNKNGSGSVNSFVSNSPINNSIANNTVNSGAASSNGFIEDSKSFATSQDRSGSNLLEEDGKDSYDMSYGTETPEAENVLMGAISATGAQLGILNERILAKYGFNSKVIYAGYTYDIYLITLEALSADKSLSSASVYEIGEDGEIAGLKARFNIKGELWDFGFDGKKGFYTDELGTNIFETVK